jgi:membrane protease YdiL (CAAX protease family)
VARRSARRLASPPLKLVVVARLVAATAAYLAAFFSSALLLYFASLVLVPTPAQGIFGLVSLGLAEGIALASVLVFWRFVDRRPLGQLGLQSKAAVTAWLRGAAVAALMMGFVVLVWYTLLDGAVWSTNPDATRAVVALTGGLLGFLIQGPAEEVLFRGYIFENVRMVWGLRWAVVVSAVGFALFHLRNPAIGPVPLLNLVLFGVATALYKVRADNGQLWGVFALHTTWNWLQQVVFGLPNSGIASVPDNALFTLTPNTSLPEPIWGGGFGPEGTLGATLVLLALIVALLRTSKKRSYEAAVTST